MIIANLNSLKKIAIVAGVQNYVPLNIKNNSTINLPMGGYSFDYVPFLNAYTGGPIPLPNVQLTVPLLDFFDSNIQSYFLTLTNDIKNYYFGLAENLSIKEIQLYEEVDAFVYSNFKVTKNLM